MAEAAVGNNRGEPAACPRGEAERFLPVMPAIREGPELAQGPRQPRPGLDPFRYWASRGVVRCCDAPPQQLGRPPEVADGIVGLPQEIGGVPLHGAVGEAGRKFQGLLAHRHGAVIVCRDL